MSSAKLHVHAMHVVCLGGLRHKVTLLYHGNVSSQIKVYKLPRMTLWYASGDFTVLA